MGLKQITKALWAKVCVCVLLVSASFFAGYNIGTSTANKKYDIVGANQIKSEHEKNIKIIRTEPDSAVIKRFSENFGTNNK